MSPTVFSRRSEWHVPFLLILLGLVPSAAGIFRLTQLAGGAAITPANARFFATPLPVVVHILSVITYSMLGAFQFAAAFRRRRRGWHRAAGKVVATCGLLAATTGLWMAHFYPWPPGDGEFLYIQRLVFGSGMLLSIGLAIRAVRRRDFVSHGAWMMRGYAIGMGAGTQVLTQLPSVILFGAPTELTRAVQMGAAWVINLAVAEWIIRKRPPDPGSYTGVGIRPAPSRLPVAPSTSR